jgi:hypothetical protein
MARFGAQRSSSFGFAKESAKVGLFSGIKHPNSGYLPTKTVEHYRTKHLYLGSPSKVGARPLLRPYNGLGELNQKGDGHALEQKHTEPTVDDDSENGGYQPGANRGGLHRTGKLPPLRLDEVA